MKKLWSRLQEWTFIVLCVTLAIIIAPFADQDRLKRRLK